MRFWYLGSEQEADALIPIGSESVLYGELVFTTLRLWKGRCLGLRYHQERLHKGMELLEALDAKGGPQVRAQIADLEEILIRLSAGVSFAHQQARVAIVKVNGAWTLWVRLQELDPTVWEHQFSKGVEVDWVKGEWALDPWGLSSQKTGYFKNIFAMNQGREIVFVNSKSEVGEAAAASIVIWKDGTWYENENLGLLPSVTLRILKETVEEMGECWVQCSFKWSEQKKVCPEGCIALVSSLRWIVPVENQLITEDAALDWIHKLAWIRNVWQKKLQDLSENP